MHTREGIDSVDVRFLHIIPPPGARRPDFMLACETLVAEGGAGTRGLHSPNISASIAILPFRDPIPTLVTWQVPF